MLRSFPQEIPLHSRISAKVLLNLPPRSSSTEALDYLDLKTLLQRRHLHRCVMIQKYLLTADTLYSFNYSFILKDQNDTKIHQNTFSRELKYPYVPWRRALSATFREIPIQSSFVSIKVRFIPKTWCPEDDRSCAPFLSVTRTFNDE